MKIKGCDLFDILKKILCITAAKFICIPTAVGIACK